MTDVFANELVWLRQGVAIEDLRATPRPLWTIELYRHPAQMAWGPFQASLSFQLPRGVEVNALAAWFRAEFGSGLVLTNASDAPRPHWGQYVFPLRRHLTAEPGTHMAVHFSCLPAGPGYCHHAWSARVGSGPWEHHDTRWGGGPGWYEA